MANVDDVTSHTPAVNRRNRRHRFRLPPLQLRRLALHPLRFDETQAQLHTTRVHVDRRQVAATRQSWRYTLLHVHLFYCRTDADGGHAHETTSGWWIILVTWQVGGFRKEGLLSRQERPVSSHQRTLAIRNVLHINRKYSFFKHFSIRQKYFHTNTFIMKMYFSSHGKNRQN